MRCKLQNKAGIDKAAAKMPGYYIECLIYGYIYIKEIS